MRRVRVYMAAGVLGLGLAMAIPWGDPQAVGDGPAKAKTAQEVLKADFKRPAVRATLAQALADLAKLAEIPIAVDWQGLLDAGVKPDAVISLPATESTLEKLLEQTLVAAAAKGRPLAWVMVEGSVCVTTQARVLRRDRFVLSEGAPATRPAEVAGATTRPAGTEAPVSGRGFKFNKTPLADVVEYLRQLSGVNMHANYSALETSGVTKDTLLTLDVSDVTIAKVLDLVVEQLSGAKGKYESIYWVVDDGVVTITTGTALDAKTQTRVFDIGDLLMAVPNMEGPRINIGQQFTRNTTNGTSGEGLFTTNNSTNTTLTGSGTLTQREDMQTKLASIIQKSIGEDMWQPQGKGNVSFLRNMMVITQTRLGFLLLQKSSVVR